MQKAAFIDSLGFLGTINEAAFQGYLTRNKTSWKQTQQNVSHDIWIFLDEQYNSFLVVNDDLWDYSKLNSISIVNYTLENNTTVVA